MRLGYWGLSRYTQKVVLFLFLFDEIGFEVLSLSDSLLFALTSADVGDLRRTHHRQLTSLPNIEQRCFGC